MVSQNSAMVAELRLRRHVAVFFAPTGDWGIPGQCPVLTPLLRRNRSSDGEDHVEALDTSCAQRASSVANRHRSLEQMVTPFRGRNTSAPDLLQLPSLNRPLRTLKDRQEDRRSDRLRRSGRHLVIRCRPELPSGRQDLNLRPLDPQMTHWRPTRGATSHLCW